MWYVCGPREGGRDNWDAEHTLIVVADVNKRVSLCDDVFAYSDTRYLMSLLAFKRYAIAIRCRATQRVHPLLMLPC